MYVLVHTIYKGKGNDNNWLERSSIIWLKYKCIIQYVNLLYSYWS